MIRNIKVGDLKKLNRPTFLYKGIFVLSGSMVQVYEIGKTISVIWNDKEGNRHILNNVREDELID